MLRELEMDMIAEVCRSQRIPEPLDVGMYVHVEADLLREMLYGAIEIWL